MSRIFEVRYDDDEAYFVAARYTDQGQANRLRERLAAAHRAADRDDCSLDSAWTVVDASVDVVDPEIELPADLFEYSTYDDGGHASVNIDRVDLTFLVESERIQNWLDAQPAEARP